MSLPFALLTPALGEKRRENRDWLLKAQNWAKFAVVASLGVIHKGHVSQAKTVLDPYLPKDGEEGNPYEQAGGLYALGMIYANHGTSIVPFLCKALASATSETVRHGASLGLGLASMGAADEETQMQLRNALAMDRCDYCGPVGTPSSPRKA